MTFYLLSKLKYKLTSRKTKFIYFPFQQILIKILVNNQESNTFILSQFHHIINDPVPMKCSFIVLVKISFFKTREDEERFPPKKFSYLLVKF